MNLDCNIVKDLVSLYKDGVVREETKRAIALHLKECEVCKQYYKSYEPIQTINIKTQSIPEYDIKKEYSDLAKKIRHRRNGIILVSTIYIFLSSLGILLALHELHKE